MNKTARRPAITLAFAALGLTAVLLGAAALSPAHAQVPASGNISSVPRNPIVHLSNLSPADTRISADEAVQAAMKQFGLTENQIDPNIGVVRALVNVPEDPLKHNIKAWIVTADVEVSHAVLGRNFTYRTLSAIINARTGRYEFGYLGNP